MKEENLELIYILSSLAAMVIFSAALVIYLLYKEINIYLVAPGLLMLGAGFVTKTLLDKTNKKS